MSDQINDHVQTVLRSGEVISALAVITTLAGFLPPIAAIFAMAWYAVQIYESPTMQRWMSKRRARRKRARISQEVEDSLR